MLQDSFLFCLKKCMIIHKLFEMMAGGGGIVSMSIGDYKEDGIFRNA